MQYAGGRKATWVRWRLKHLPYIVRACAICGKDFNPRGKQKWCPVCQWVTCPICNSQFRRTNRHRKFCSQSCNASQPATVERINSHRGTKPRTYHLRQRDKHGNAFDREWRLAVFERDNYTCVFCGKRGGKLQADHIKPFKEFPELRYELSNGRTLCVKCHRKTESYGWSKYWYGRKIAAKRMSQTVMAPEASLL